MTQTRPLQRWVGHADLDAFYASIEERDRPECRGRPVVVGALPGHRGVVATANYQARTFGIRSAMPIAEAYRRCPDAVYLRPDMAKYARLSREIFQILESITPLVEPVSVDEAYLDLSGLEKLLGPPETIGREIKHRIFSRTGLTASVGIGPNRLIAKLGSERHKPDGLTVVAPDQVLDFLAPLPVGDLRGVGKQTRKILTRLGIQTVAQLRNIPLPYLEAQLGSRTAASLHDQALGIASAAVIPGRERKSLSKETTFEEDVTDPVQLRSVLSELAAEVGTSTRKEGLAGSVVTLKIRYSDFETHTRQHKLPAPTCDERVILREAWSLYQQGGLPQKAVRLIGVGISHWDTEESPQPDLFESSQPATRDNELLATVDRITERFGKGLLEIGRVRKSNKREP